MAANAQLIQFGGEVASVEGGTATGQMGSGALAAAGYLNAAYQRAAVYFSLLGIPTAPTLAGDGIPTIPKRPLPVRNFASEESSGVRTAVTAGRG